MCRMGGSNTDRCLVTPVRPAEGIGAARPITIRIIGSLISPTAPFFLPTLHLHLTGTRSNAYDHPEEEAVMLAFLLCLPVLLLPMSLCHARPVHHATLMQSCPAGRQPMPQLNGLVLRTNPQVLATGRLIKGLYYSYGSSGPYDMVAFYMACDGHSEPAPFVVTDFRSRQLFFDRDRDGCADATETLPQPEIDPADILPAVNDVEQLCSEGTVSSLIR